MTFWAIDLGNGIEDYNPFDTFQAAFDKACEIVESDFYENYEKGMSEFYRGREDFEIVEMRLDENDNPIEVSRRKCWASIDDNGFYKKTA